MIVSAMIVSQWIGETGPWTMFGGAHWLKTTSVIVIVTGLVIRCTAIVTLGKSFSSNVAIQESQNINRSGLYSMVRHPSYLGLLLIFLAAGLHTRSWIGFALAVVPTGAAMLYRIRVEEAALSAAFGEEYVAYMRQTRRLVPGIY